jgi:peptidoglycan/LPS O-acetylase OafA/YrhL
MSAGTTVPPVTPQRGEGADSHAFPALDGIRGAAAAAVLLTHVAFATGTSSEGAFGALLARLDFGVALFFLLSGFLLSRPWLVAAAGEGRAVSVRVYAIRRLARIMPLYWLVLAIVLIVVPANRAMNPVDVSLNALLLQIYPADALPHALTQAWSLATEVSFYACLPFLAPLLTRAAAGRGGPWRPGRALSVLVVLMVGGLAFIVMARWPDGPLPAQAGFWLPYSIAWFALGMLLALLEQSLRSGGLDPLLAVLKPLAEHVGTCWAIAAGAFVLAATPLAGPRAFEAPTDPLSAAVKAVLYGLSAFFVLLPFILVRRGAGPIRIGMQSRVARWFGDTSYGVFLWHLLILEGVMWGLGIEPFTGGFLVVAPLTYAVTLGVAEVSHRLLERPIVSLAARYRPRSPRRVAQPSGRRPVEMQRALPPT